MTGRSTCPTRWRSTGVLLALVVLAGCVPRAPAAPPFTPNVVRRIALQDVVGRMQAGEAGTFLDARPRVVGPMIEGAVHVPRSWLEVWAKEQPRDAFIVAYDTCRHEAAAAHTVLELQRRGFTNAYALLGGFRAWTRSGRPIELER